SSTTRSSSRRVSAPSTGARASTRSWRASSPSTRCSRSATGARSRRSSSSRGGQMVGAGRSEEGEPGPATGSMGADRVFLDTNVLVYGYDLREPVKRARARRLLAELNDAVVSTQVLAEFYVALTRTAGGVKPPVAPAEAEAAVASLCELTV